MTPYRANHANHANTSHNRNNTHTYITPLSASTSTSSSSFSHTPASSSSSSSFANTSASGSGSNHLTRSATVRERRGQPKWSSEDLGGPPSASAASSSASFISGDSRYQERGEYTRDRRESVMGMGEYRERRQSLRAGSAESALAHGSGGRSFFAEGLKAAGLSPSKSKPGRVSLGAARHGGGRSGGDVFTRPGEGYDDEEDGRTGRTRAGTLVGSRAGGGSGLAARAATSMADYRYLGRRDVDVDDDEDDGVGVGTRRELRVSKSAFPLREGGTPRELQKQKERETSLTREREREISLTRDRERDIDRAASSMSRYTSTRAPQERYSSPFGTKRYNSTVGPGALVQVQTPTQEHTRLMMESLAMFEGHLMRLGLGGSGGGLGGGGGGGGNELLRTAQGVASAAEKLNAMLRYGVSTALDEQVDAEVEEGEGRAGAREAAEIWRRVGGEYREGQRVSDELVRALTGLLLGVGKVMRDFAGSGGEGQHARSVSLDEEGLGLSGRRTRGSMSPDVPPGGGGGGSNGGGGSTGGGSGSGRRSVESRRSWDPAAEALREDTSRRLSARAESALGAARPPSSFNTLRDQYRSTPPPAATPQTGQRNSNMTGNNQSTRRLFTPREQREQRLDAQYANTNMNQADTLYADYEPSPTPASRHQNQTTLDRSRTLPSLAIPKPLPTLPSESLRRSQTSSSKAMPPPNSTVRDRDRRKVSVASVSTVRANTGTFPASLTTPSSATTALTAHTVSTSHTPDKTAFPSLNRHESDRSARSTVTFSRPSTISISALNGLQQQHLDHQRKRTGSGASSGAEPSTSVPPKPHMAGGAETERDVRRKTLGARTPRASLDSSMEGGGSKSRTSTVHAADRSAAVALGVGSGGIMPPMNTARRERRRTVTDIWPHN
ncbi:hypothetical protein BDZ94DRAFT_1320402 [Collybia nuda]|uniref:Uncharacterized protein n=1 Tax=Collybia nuda TaxID=64659 RepID=A0A9P5YAY1_9AGAR|nr:hypothetical protein BDZ94DRAFT_1320402 [Collybia nuda]